MTDTVIHKSGRIFYGWFALIGVMLVIFIVGGSFVASFGVLLPVISNEFGWSRALIAAALSMGVLAFGLPSPLFGVMVSRIGPRFPIILGNLLAGLGIAGISLVQEIWHFYLLYILIGLGAGFGGYIASTTVINNWFIKKRSLALGLFAACGGLGGLVFPLVATALISAIGWRMSWLVLAGLVLVVPVFVGGVIIVRNRPEDMNLVPDGVPGGPFFEEAAVRKDEKSTDPHVQGVLKQPTAWMIGAFAAAAAFTQGTMMTHQIAYLQDIGFNPMTAATTLSFMSVFSLMGSVGFGTLALKYNVRYLTCAAFALQLVGLAILLTTRELTLIYVYAAFQGMSAGSLIAALPTFVGAYYPRGRYARVLGVVFPFQVVSNAVAAIAAGAVYDATSTYIPAFATAAALSFCGLIFAFLARKPRPYHP